MKSYKERFVSALNYTKELGLDPGGSPIPWSNNGKRGRYPFNFLV